MEEEYKEIAYNKELPQEQEFKFDEPEYLENNPEYQGDLIDEAEWLWGER